MMTVNDFSDMFVPVVDGFLVRLEESGEMLDTLLDYIPKIFAGSRETDTILLPVIQSGMRALEVWMDRIIFVLANDLNIVQRTSW